MHEQAGNSHDRQVLTELTHAWVSQVASTRYSAGLVKWQAQGMAIYGGKRTK